MTDRAPGRLRVLCVVERLSAQGGADRYLEDLIREIGDREVEWIALYGYADRTAGSIRELFSRSIRSKPIGRRVPHSRDGEFRVELRRKLDDLAPDRILVQNALAPVVLEELSLDPRSLLIVQDHRVFCPARGKVLPDGEPCREPAGEVCDQCFMREDGLDVSTRDLRLDLTEARLLAVRRFCRSVVLSEYMRRELEAAGVDPERLHLIPPALPAWVISGCELEPSGGTEIAVVGRISWHKGSYHLIESLAKSKVRAPIRMIGSGPAARSMAELASDLGCDLEMTGWLAPLDMRAELARARLVVLPALWAEPFGIAGLEASGLGLPVVAHDVGGIREWLRDGETGCLVPANDGPALVRAVQELLVDGGLADRLGRAGRRHSLASFSSDSFRSLWRGELGLDQRFL